MSFLLAEWVGFTPGLSVCAAEKYKIKFDTKSVPLMEFIVTIALVHGPFTHNNDNLNLSIRQK